MMKASFATASLALAACSPPNLLSSFNKFVPGDAGAYRVAEGVTFAPDRGLKLDVWCRRRTDHKLPVIIFFYGGSWVGGSRGGYAFAGSAYAGQGFVTVVPDYRLVPTVRFPAFVNDGALAVKWTRDNIGRFGGDPDRIALAGHSAGSYNAAMLALDSHFLRDVGVRPDTIKGAALLSGPYDFYPFTEERGREALGGWPRPRETQPINFVTPSKVASVSPIRWPWSAKIAPLLWAGEISQTICPTAAVRLSWTCRDTSSASSGRYGNQDGQFDLAHDVIMDKQGAIYIVDTWGQRVQKFVPSRRAK
jgi:acetyl esterase/lipase